MNKKIKIMIFTEGTIIMHKDGANHTRKEIVNQVKKKEPSVHDFKSYIPIGSASEKLNLWKAQSIKLIYLTSRRRQIEINQVRSVLKKYKFPKGRVVYRKKNEEYNDVAEREIPDILIEDDCESIGGKKEMTITNVKPIIKKRIKSICIKEFGGIDHLPDRIQELMFTEIEQRAISEKFEQLKKVKDGKLTSKELADLITQRRVKWIKENLDEMLKKYKGLSPEEQAYRIVCFDHMGINPMHSKMIRVSPTKIRIESSNFCPYLEACNKLDLDTRFVCKEIGEPSIQEMIKIINPNLRFSRNYKQIRPQAAFCEEYMELLWKLYI